MLLQIGRAGHIITQVDEDIPGAAAKKIAVQLNQVTVEQRLLAAAGSVVRCNLRYENPVTKAHVLNAGPVGELVLFFLLINQVAHQIRAKCRILLGGVPHSSEGIDQRAVGSLNIHAISR